jgi:outer membrane protein TolC
MKKSSLGILVFLAFQLPLSAQQMTLKQALDYAFTNNSNVKISKYDTKIAAKKVTEQIGTALPQIDANGTYTDNLEVSTSLLPGIILGRDDGSFIPVKMGKEYSAVGTLTLNQKIFDPIFWVALKAARVSDVLASQNERKTNEQTAYNVSSAYYKAVIVKKQLDILKSTLDASEKTLASTQLKYNNGMVRKTELDKIKVSYNNTKSQCQQTELNYEQTLNSLKFEMGMPVEDALSVSESMLDEAVDTARTLLDNDNYIENRIDYQLQQTNLHLMEANKQQYIASYMPTLSFFANYGYTAMRDEFNFLSGEEDWFRSSSIGLKLTVPIFSGFSRASRVSQANVSIEKTKESIKLTEQSIKLDVFNSEVKYRNAIDNIQNEKESLALAQSVYDDTQAAFRAGSQSSLDLIQAETSLLTAQNNYFNKLLSLYTARLDLEKSKGSLMNFINNLK